MRIQHNIAALNSYRNLGANHSGVAKNLEKLSSGYRINRAGDDAAGLAISEKMRSQITGLNTATKNANDGISLVQTAEGALTEVHSMLNRMVEIATQSSNGVYENSVDRKALQEEMDALTSEIDRIADGTNFNKKNLLDGSIAKGATGSISSTAVKTTTIAAVDLKFEFGSLYTNEEKGITKGQGLTIKLVDDQKTVASAEEKVTFKDGTITIQLNAGKTYSADAIAKMISEASKKDEGNVLKNDASFKDAVLGLTISGKGIEGATGNNGDDGVKFHASELKGVVATQTVTDGVTINDKSMSLQIGDTNADFNKLTVSVKDMHAQNLGLREIDVKTEKAAGDAIDVINRAINTVSTQRGQLGAIQNRLEHTINNLSVNAENMTAAESRIRDVDMADEMMKYTKNNILVQASQAMLAQANQVPQGVLQLLQ